MDITFMMSVSKCPGQGGNGGGGGGDCANCGQVTKNVDR